MTPGEFENLLRTLKNQERIPIFIPHQTPDMKYVANILFFLICTAQLFGQHASVSISNDFTVKENGFKDQSVTHSIYYNDNFYTVTNSGTSGAKWLFTKLYDVKYGVTVTRFDKDMKTVGQVELENGAKTFGPLQPSMLCFNNRLFVAYFKANDKNSFSLYLAQVNENDLSLGAPLTLCSIQQENVGFSSIMSVIESGLVYFAVSPDSSRLLVACKSAQGKIQTIVVDKDLHILKQATTPINLASFTIPSAVLTNDNGACLVLSSKDETRIVGIGPDGHKTETRYGSSGNLAPNNCRVKLSRDGKSIFVFGAANNSSESSAFWCGGFIIGRVDAATFKLAKPLNYTFDEDFLKAMAEGGGGIKHKGFYPMYNFSPSLLEMDNGDLALFGSPTITTAANSQSAPNMQNQTHTTSTTTLNVGPIFILFPDAKGKTFGQVIIPRQIVLDKAYTSGSGAIQMVQSPSVSNEAAGFIAKPLGNEFVIIYNDNAKNLSESVDKKAKASKRTGDLELAEALVNNERKLEYRRLISQIDKGRATFYLGDAVPGNSSDIVFPIGKESQGMGAPKTIFTNWCFLDIK